MQSGDLGSSGRRNDWVKCAWVVMLCHLSIGLISQWRSVYIGMCDSQGVEMEL